MKRLLCVLSLLLLGVSRGFSAEYLTLNTQDDITTAPYKVTTQVGVAGQNQIDESTLIRGPIADATFGIGDWAEVGLNWELLSLSSSPSFSSHTGSGDVRIHLKAIPIQMDWGNLGFAVITKIPSADDGTGLGTDEADVVLKAIYGTKVLTDLHLFVNLGVAIQGDPRTNSSQDDFFLWGIGMDYPLSALAKDSLLLEGLSVIAEFAGSIGPEDNTNIALGEYTDGSAEFRAGFVKEVPWFNMAVTGSAGLTNDSPDWGFRIFFSRTFDLPVVTRNE